MKRVIAMFDVETDNPKIALTLVSFMIHRACEKERDWDKRISPEYKVFEEPA